MPSAPQLESRPASHQHATPRSVIYKLIFSTALITCAATFIAPLVNAQDLGEIARQERAKKQSNPAPPATHVYTNEDLKREEILTPEDKTRFSASTQPATVKPAQSAPQLASESTPGNADLLIGARPPIPIPSTTPNATSAPRRDSVQQSAAKKTNQIPALKNISSAPTIRTKTNATPTIRANIFAASATSVKSVPAASSRPAPTPIPVTAAQPVTQVFAQTIIINDAPSPAIVPLDQMPLGDVARFYRAKKRLYAQSNSQTDPGPANAPSASTLATRIPTTAISLEQMPLGDVARYYRAKKSEEDAAIADRTPGISAMPVSPSTQSTVSNSPASKSKYPLTLAAMPLATMKPPPTRTNRPHPSPIVPIAPRPIARPTTSHPPVAPKPSSAGRAASIRISSGDTLWQLARKYLGTGARWHELATLNPTIQDPRRLQIGAQLVLHLPTP